MEETTSTGTLSTLPRGVTFGYARAQPAGASAREATMDAEVAQATEIMARYCAGEVMAFHRLYAMLAPRILGYLTGLLGNRASAEDALQVSFLKVHEARATYVLGANPIPWVYTIAHRVALDELRRRKRSRVLLTKDGDIPGAEPEASLAGLAHETAIDLDAPGVEEASRAMAMIQGPRQRAPKPIMVTVATHFTITHR